MAEVTVRPLQASEEARYQELMQSHHVGASSAIIGEVQDESRGLVALTSRIGSTRIIDLISGEQLPRIC